MFLFQVSPSNHHCLSLCHSTVLPSQDSIPQSSEHQPGALSITLTDLHSGEFKQHSLKMRKHTACFCQVKPLPLGQGRTDSLGRRLVSQGKKMPKSEQEEEEK